MICLRHSFWLELSIRAPSLDTSRISSPQFDSSQRSEHAGASSATTLARRRHLSTRTHTHELPTAAWERATSADGDVRLSYEREVGIAAKLIHVTQINASYWQLYLHMHALLVCPPELLARSISLADKLICVGGSHNNLELWMFVQKPVLWLPEILRNRVTSQWLFSLPFVKCTMHAKLV